MRATIHIGLAFALVFGPAICCCRIRCIAQEVAFAGLSSVLSTAGTPISRLPECCSISGKSAEEVCCRATQSEPLPILEQHAEPSTGNTCPPGSLCRCCASYAPDALPTPAVVVPVSDSANDLRQVAWRCISGFPPEHLGLLGGLGPPERAGVDTRSEALLSRHVLRC
jgi:hypothetical protein